MYLLRKLGIPLAALLILSILALITVVLLYEQNGLHLPSFKRPQTDPPETTVSPESEITSNSDLDNKNILLTGGIFK